jgi:hypothetical protein
LNWWRNEPRLTATPIGSLPSDAETRLRNIEQQLNRLIGETEPKRKNK